MCTGGGSSLIPSSGKNFVIRDTLNKGGSPNRCIRMLATEFLGKISVASTRTLGCDEEPLLSSGWTLIGSELSSPNFNSSVRAERSFAIRYLNVVIKPL